MKSKLLSLLTSPAWPALLVAVLLTGCYTPRTMPCGISKGKFLSEEEYAELQRVASNTRVGVAGKVKEGWRPVASWVYYCNAVAQINQQPRICIPDLSVAVEKSGGLEKSVPELLAKKLVAEKIFSEAARTASADAVIMEGVVTKRETGGAVGQILLGARNAYGQVEGRLLLKGKPVGAFQINSQKFFGPGGLVFGVSGLITSAILSSTEGSAASLAADKICDMFKAIKEGKASGALSDGSVWTNDAF